MSLAKAFITDMISDLEELVGCAELTNPCEAELLCGAEICNQIGCIPYKLAYARRALDELENG